MGIKVKVTEIDISNERKMIIGMIVSDNFLRQVLTVYKSELMESSHLKLVAGWCQNYFEKYKKAPKKDIQEIFESQVRQNRISEEDEEFISAVLTSLNEEWEEEEDFNEEYLLDQTEEYFKRRSLLILSEDIKSILSGNQINPKGKDWEEAEELIREFKRVERPVTAGVNPFADEEALQQAFQADKDVLFSMPGELGRLLGPFSREDFSAFMGPEKRGKTFWLMESAIRALRQGRKVAFISAGDMSQNQMILRFSVYLSKRHYKKRYCKEGLLPTMDCWFNQINQCTLSQRTCSTSVIKDLDSPRDILSFEEAEDYIPCTACRKDDPDRWKGAVWYEVRPETKPLEWKEAFEKGVYFTKRYGSKTFRLISFPNNSISVYGIRGLLNRWEDQGFVPDVIIIDYADILASLGSTKDFRHQQNETWQELRALSQERHCCVLTATQADAKSYEQRHVRETHFTEDKRKYGHVNKGIITLNQDAYDKRRKIIRIGQMFVREDEFDIAREVTVLQGLVVGRPYLDSFFAHEEKGG